MKSMVKLLSVLAIMLSTSVHADSLSGTDISTLTDVTAATADLVDALTAATGTGAVVVQGTDGATAMILQQGTDNTAIIQQATSGAFAVVDQSNATGSKALVIQK